MNSVMTPRWYVSQVRDQTPRLLLTLPSCWQQIAYGNVLSWLKKRWATRRPFPAERANDSVRSLLGANLNSNKHLWHFRPWAQQIQQPFWNVGIEQALVSQSLWHSQVILPIHCRSDHYTSGINPISPCRPKHLAPSHTMHTRVSPQGFSQCCKHTELLCEANIET